MSVPSSTILPRSNPISGDADDMPDFDGATEILRAWGAGLTPDANLRAVHTTVPGRPSVNELIAQNIEPVEDEAQDACTIACLEGLREGAGRGLEAILPILEPVNPIVVLPKGIEDIPVFHEHPNRAGKSLPQRLVDALVFIKSDQSPEIIYKGCAFPWGYRLKFLLVGIGGVERNPEENEARIVILAAGLCTTYPTDCAMGAQSHGFGKTFSNGALFCFQGCMVETVFQY